MDLLKLAAKIELDDSSYKSGIKQAEDMGNKLAGKMSAMTVAVGNLAADVIRNGVSAIQNVIGGAIDGYADYQQLIGGVETLFKSSADKVANYAKKSFKTTGLSSNQYMETVTSFSASLLQGLNGDTEKAADMADMAITDMADNANKMGTDISSIQTAYQGFAKQNYTMLDNLKLGYGGTKEEMVRLINDSGILDKKIKNLDGITFDQMVQAIHEVQTQMGITGTTAKEAADTISGSKGSLKAAWEDLMSAVGGEGEGDGGNRLSETLENFKTSFQTYMDNYIPALEGTIGNVGELVRGVSEAVANLPRDLISNLVSSSLTAGTGIIEGAENIVGWLIDSITASFSSTNIDQSKITAFGEALGHFVGSSVGKIITNLPAVLEGLVQVGITLAGSIIQGIWEGLFGTGGNGELEKIKTELSDTLTQTEMNSTKVQALLTYMQQLYEKNGAAAKSTVEWKEAEEELETVMSGSGKIFETYGSNIQGAINKLSTMNEQLRQAAIMNALDKAASEELELLTEQTLQYNKAKARKERAESAQETYTENTRQEIMKAAAEQADRMLAASHDENGNYTGNDNSYYDLRELANGAAVAGDELVSLSELDFSQLEGLIDMIADSDLTAGYEDDKALYAEAQATIKAAEEEMKAGEDAIKETREQIATTRSAMEDTVKDLMGSGKKAASSVSAGGTTLYNTFLYLARKFASIEVNGGPGGGKDTKIDMPQATGMDYVPYNGFRASLHKGEAILTKSENEKRSAGNSDVVEAIQELRQDMQNLRLTVGRKTFGRAVVDYGGGRMSDYIGRADSTTAAGFGT